MNPTLFPQSGANQSFPTPSSTPKPSTPIKPDGLEPPATGPLAPVERKIYRLFTRPAVSMSIDIRDIVASYLPWLVIISAFVIFPLIATAVINSNTIGLLSVGKPITNPAYWIELVILVAQFVLLIRSVLPLIHHRRIGWKRAFFATIFGCATPFAAAFANFTDPLVTLPVVIVVTIIALYLMSQVRSYFTE